MPRPRAVGQVEDLVLVVGEAGVDRVPLDPGLQHRTVVDVRPGREDVALRAQRREVRQPPLGDPAIDQRRTKLVELEQDDPARRRSRKGQVPMEPIILQHGRGSTRDRVVIRLTRP